MKNFRLLAFVLLTSSALLLNGCNNSNSSPDKTAIESIVHDYLLSHPEILIQISQQLQDKQMQQQQAQAKEVIKKEASSLFSNPQSPVAGDEKGNITLVEFFDYQCVHCEHMYPIVKSLMQKNPNLRVVFKEFPIFGQASEYAARAALAAAKQGKYVAMHDALFAANDIEGKMTIAAVEAIAKKAGLNLTQLHKDMQEPAITAEIKNNYMLAQALGLPGTPGFIIAPTPGTTDATNSNKITFLPGGTTDQQLQQAINAAK